MHSHDWDCDGTHAQFDCPRTYPISTVRVITAFDRHVQQALDLVSSR